MILLGYLILLRMICSLAPLVMEKIKMNFYVGKGEVTVIHKKSDYRKLNLNMAKRNKTHFYEFFVP